jgi:hypothetical protein
MEDEVINMEEWNFEDGLAIGKASERAKIIEMLEKGQRKWLSSEFTNEDGETSSGYYLEDDVDKTIQKIKEMK